MAKKTTVKAIEDRTAKEHFSAVRLEARQRLDAGQFEGFSEWFVEELQKKPGFIVGKISRLNGQIAETDPDNPEHDAHTALEGWMAQIEATIPENPDAQL